MTDTIKSARRVLEVLEFFAERQSGATAHEIRSGLGYPQSSTSILLRSLLSMGYVSYDEHQRTFKPTIRVALLGDWIVEAFGHDASPPAVMRWLQAQTGDTVVLGTQSNMDVVYVQVLQATNPVRFFMKPGMRRPVCQTAVGRALLSLQPNRNVRLLIRRINAEKNEGAPRVSERGVLEAIQLGREVGYFCTLGTATPGAGVVAIPVNTPGAGTPMAIGIGAPIDRIRDKLDEYVKVLCTASGRMRPVL